MKEKPTLSTFTTEDVREAFEAKKKSMGMAVCDMCSETFKRKRRAQRFCQDSCRANYHNLLNMLKADEQKRLKAKEEEEWEAANPRTIHDL